MARAKLKTGEIIEKPLEQMLEFLVAHPDVLGCLDSSRPMPNRRSQQKEQQKEQIVNSSQ